MEVDRIPSEHLNKHQVSCVCGLHILLLHCAHVLRFLTQCLPLLRQDLLEHASYIEDEREYLGEQLSEMEREMQRERREREDLQRRLQSLQKKVGGRLKRKRTYMHTHRLMLLHLYTNIYACGIIAFVLSYITHPLTPFDECLFPVWRWLCVGAHSISKPYQGHGRGERHCRESKTSKREGYRDEERSRSSTR